MSLSSIPLSSELEPVLRFGLFEADLRAGELRKNGVKIKIQDLPFRALTVLLSRPDEIVSREEFRQALWPPDVFVDFDRAISSAIKRLRDALGDSADNPIFIETVDRRGYRWIAPISAAPISSVQTPAASAAGDHATVAPVSPGESRVLDRDSDPQLRSMQNERTGASLSAPHSLAWKSAYLLPLLLLLLIVWSFRSGFRSAKAGGNGQRLPFAANGAHPANQEAKDLYLQGRYYWNKRTPESLNQAVDAFTQAIVHDPGYSDAYVGLADCYNLLREFSLMPATEAYPRALAAAKKAVELDDRSSEAHASLAFVSFYGMWDVARADKEFRRAIELDAKNAKAHHWYAGFLGAQRRFDESLAEINHAQALDPDSRSILADKGRFLWGAGHRDEALQLLKKVEASDPDFISPHRYLKLAYLESADYPAYLSEMKKEAGLLHDNSAAALAEAAEKGFAERGGKGMLLSELQLEKKFFEQGKISPYFVAETYARLGDTEQAMTWIETCYTRHDQEVVNLATDPAYVSLHRLPAFQQLLAKVGLPPVS